MTQATRLQSWTEKARPGPEKMRPSFGGRSCTSKRAGCPSQLRWSSSNGERRRSHSTALYSTVISKSFSALRFGLQRLRRTISIDSHASSDESRPTCRLSKRMGHESLEYVVWADVDHVQVEVHVSVRRMVEVHVWFKSNQTTRAAFSTSAFSTYTCFSCSGTHRHSKS